VEDAVKACELIRAKLHVPMHYNTFPVVKADAGAWVKKVEAKGMKARIVEPGGSIEV